MISELPLERCSVGVAKIGAHVLVLLDGPAPEVEGLPFTHIEPFSRVFGVLCFPDTDADTRHDTTLKLFLHRVCCASSLACKHPRLQ